jgi:DNA-binding NarL/FixJ family response regulator
LIDGVLARGRGEDGAKCAAALDAAARFASIGWPLFEAACRELGDDVAGALALYRAAGALAEVRRLERTALAAAPVARPERGVLTPRERDVARMVAAGKANQATADALGITKKAVEKYLTSIYSKLGIASRAQLAAYLTQAADRHREHDAGW